MSEAKIIEIIKTQNKKIFKLLFDAKSVELYNNYNWTVSNSESGGKTHFYLMRRLYISKNKYRNIKFHRQLMLPDEDRVIDHINGNGLDNRISNLRIVTEAQNNRNTKVRTVNKTSKYKGVRFVKNRSIWTAQIGVNGKQKHLGQYKTEKEAAKVYDKAALHYYKEFANLNFKGNI